MPNVGVQRLPVGLTEPLQSRPSLGVAAISGGQDLAPLRCRNSRAHTPRPPKESGTYGYTTPLAEIAMCSAGQSGCSKATETVPDLHHPRGWVRWPGPGAPNR